MVIYEHEKKYFEFNVLLNWEPMKLLKARDEMIKYRGFGDDVGSRALNQLERMEELFR